jgi:hypothetical protein
VAFVDAFLLYELRIAVGDDVGAAPDDCPHAGNKIAYSAATDAAALGNAALTNLMESGTNGPATIIGNSRQNLGNLRCVGWWRF